jgi:formylglycine-generating enzyme required for sulfatase activity
VDWCDAAAFCRYAGKRLCGRIGGGATPGEQCNDAAVDEWTAACSGGGVYMYPYGDTYEPTACWGSISCDTSGCRPVDVGSLQACQSAVYPGVYDMSGNVVEWTDGCRPRANTAVLECPQRGGYMLSSKTELSCMGTLQVGLCAYAKLDNYNIGIGFRCCADRL